MKGEGTELTLEKERLPGNACLVSTPHSVSVVLKPGEIDECCNNQANQRVTLSPITLTQSSTQESHTSRDIKATLENESVWSRFHSLGTEMILTKQGRRMFPCCRFRLSGLDPQRKYFLVMEIMSLDDFTHKWNGKTWEPVAVDEPHVRGQICVHPESPALGQQWMDSPVSFYKVKLSNDSLDQEGCVLLRPMHRYLPRLHIVPVDPDSERTIALDGPNVKLFSFPQTEFYAVTSYQNPQITQLKIDCNPFAMAFREDTPSIRLLQDKLRLCSSAGTHFRSPLLSLAQNVSGKQKEGAVKSKTPTCIQDNRRKVVYPGSASLKEGEGIFTKMRIANFSCPTDMALCQENTDNSENDGGNEAVVNKCPLEPVLDEHVAPLDFEPSVTESLEEPLPSTDEPVPQLSSTENPRSSEASKDAVKSQIICANSDSPTKSSMATPSPQTRGEIESGAVSLPRPPFLDGSQVHEHKPGHRCNRRSRKAKSKRWSNAKYAKSPPAVVPLNVPLQPDLEDVEGMLFVSFVAKEALNIPVENIKESETSVPPPSPTHDQSDNHDAEDVSLSIEERIAKLENILLLHLKQQKYRQVIHPRLQDVGMKLSLLDPKLPIDLQYLGVHLPHPPPIHEGSDKMNPTSLSSSPDAAGFFVSRTGKTNDPTKIKGWREKFKTNTVQNAPEGLKNSSAFCSEMLDAYLENEAQQISDRVAVFSKCSALPVSYQLPSKSSSYVVTLDSLLKTRSISSSKVCTKPTDKIQPVSSPRRSPSSAVPLSPVGFQKKRRTFAHPFQSHRHTVQANRSMSFVSRRGLKKQPGKSQLRWIPVKVKDQMMLEEMEKEAIFHGKVRTHITTMRAKFALTSLLNFQKSGKRPGFPMHHKAANACSEDFCRLGCMCDSLDREIRGPTHCRRVECMFDCNCFKHKVLLLHPPKEAANVLRGRKRSVLAFPIADPEREPRPPPAPSITTLWKRATGEHDPEPLFVPAPPISSKNLSRLHTSLTHSTSQVPEEDKDPVYLYFESMMTCARVREYNSNPPPQIHMFPTKKEMTGPEQLNEVAEAGEPPSSQKTPETNPTETLIKPSEPQPTKMLEILSECNWEPHRNLVLSALFRRMNRNLLSEPFCFGMYKIQLLSTTTKRVNRSSTVTYKVCISRADEKEMTEDLLPPVKKSSRNQSLKGFVTKLPKTDETQAQKAAADTDSVQKSSGLVEKKQKKLPSKRLLRAWPFFTHAAPVGCLKADKKKPGSHTQGQIKVNGKTYTQAKLLLGQLGALHPVNRVAAFITGRLLSTLRDQPKIEYIINRACPPKVANVSNQTPSSLAAARPPLAGAPEPSTASKDRRSNISPSNALSKHVGPDLCKSPTVPDGTRFLLVSLTPSNSAAVPSAETVTSSTLPPGQQVVLQAAPGMQGSNFLCQYNGQMIQLQPISPGPLVQPPPGSAIEGATSKVMQSAYNSSLPADTRSLQKPLNSTPLTTVLPKPFPVIAPKVFSLSAKSGMNIANGMPAFHLHSSFPGKTGTFSFRICPPNSEGKPVGSEHGDKPLEPSVDSPSTLVLPGGFTLIKLVHPAVPAVPANVTSAASHPAEIPQNDENMKKSLLQSGSPSLEQNSQVSDSMTKPLTSETSNCNSVQGATAGLSQSNHGFPSEGVIKDEPVEHFSESVNTVSLGKYDWVPEGAEIVHKSDVIDSEPNEADDWPPNGAERILWIDSADEEETEDLNKELNKNSDVAAGSQAAEEASESTTGTVKADFSSSNECLYEDKLHFNVKQTPKPPHVHENGLLPEEDACSESSHAHEHLKSSMPNNDPGKVCDPFVNEAISNTANISQIEPPRISFGSPNIREQVMVQENCPLVLIKSEPYDKPTEIDLVGNEPDIKNQGLLPENSTVRISKIESYNSQAGENTLLDNFLIREQRLGSANNYGVSIKIESCSDSSRTDSSFMDDVAKEHIGSENILPPINKEEPNTYQTVSGFSSDPSKQGLGSENISQILNYKEFCNYPAKPNTIASLHAEDSHENIDVASNASCALLNSQTPVMNSPPTAHLLNTASLCQKTGLKNISPFSHNVHKSSPCQSDDFGNLSDNCTKTFKRNKQDLREGKDEAEHRSNRLKTAVGELCDEEITVDVVNLSEEEDQSDESDRDEDSSSDYGEDDSNSDEEESSNNSTSDTETTDDGADISNEDDVDVESFEDNDGKWIIDMIKDETRHKLNAKRAAKLRKKVKHLASIIGTAGSVPMQELEKRLNHTEKERVRRDEMRQYFVALKKALNVDERVRLCRHDILNQARLMIQALEDRSHCLEEKKKALFQRRSAFLNKIVELSEKTELGDKASSGENHEQQKQFGSQNILQTSVPGPVVNLRRLDSEGNRLPPRLGRWKAPNYIRKRSKKALRQPSAAADESLDSHLSPDSPGKHTVSGLLPPVKTEDLVRTLIEQNLTGLPPVCKTLLQKSLSTEPKSTEKRSLPKIVLQSFGKTDAVKLKYDIRTSLPNSTEVCNSTELLKDGNLDLQDQNKGMEKCDAARVSNGMEKTLVSEHSNNESLTPSSAVTESGFQNDTAAVVKGRKRRGNSDVVIGEALPNTDVLQPMQLRKRSPAVNGGATRGGSTNKRRRII